MIDFDTFKKLPKNVGDLGKLIVAKGFKKLPKVKKIAQYGHMGKSHKWPIAVKRPRSRLSPENTEHRGKDHCMFGLQYY